MSEHDPIWRAAVNGDEACPDGRALAAIGDLVRRTAKPAAADLVSRVRGACELVSNDEGDSLVDELYDEGSEAAAAADPELAAIARLVREVATPNREVDLLPQLHRRLVQTRSSRRSSVVPKVDRSTSWRIWTAVIGGHVAALFALAILNVRYADQQVHEGGNDLADAVISYPEHVHITSQVDMQRLRPPTSTAGGDDLELELNWHAFDGGAERLFELRSEQSVRDQARAYYRLDDSSGTVRAALTWLTRRQDPVTGIVGTLSGDEAVDCAVQGIVALTFLGEGLGNGTRAAAVQRQLNWLASQHDVAAEADAVTAGAVALALIEGAILFEDGNLRIAAEAVLSGYSGPIDAAAGGRSGFLMLAASLATLAHYEVPERLQQALAEVADANAVPGEDIGRVGLRTFAIQAHSGVHESLQLVVRLADHQPIADADGTIDPLAWLFPSMAMRETGGTLWWQWCERLQSALLPQFTYTSDDQAWVTGEKVKYAGVTGEAADVFATSVVLLNLQVAYRYLPLAL